MQVSMFSQALLGKWFWGSPGLVASVKHVVVRHNS